MSTDLPLSGYTVLDLTQARAGPTAVRLLADWGARVIRIVPPPKLSGDLSEKKAADAQNLHRNKRGLALNLKADAGRGIFLSLARQSDIIVENFRADVKHRLGVDYESVAALNPRIIYASISGFGQSGPYASRPGVDQITQGTSGLMSVTGKPGDGPMRVGIAISDTSAGMFLGQGILLALLQREKTGRGQWVHTSLLEAMLSKLDFQGSRYTMDGDIPEQQGNFHPTNVPMGLFEAADGYVNVCASGDRMFNAFCRTLDVTHLQSDERFATDNQRVVNRQAINEVINDITKHFTVADLVERLNPAGVPCGPVNNIGQAFEDRQVKHLNMVWPAPHAERGEVNLVRTPINLSEHPHNGRFHHSGPKPGEHTDEILLEFGFEAEQIAQWRSQKVIQ